MRTIVCGLLQNYLCKTRGQKIHFSVKSLNQTKHFKQSSLIDKTQLEHIRPCYTHSTRKPGHFVHCNTSYRLKSTVKSFAPTDMPGRQVKNKWNRVVTIKQRSKNNEAKVLTFNVSVLDTHQEDLDQQRSTVVAVHGFPGSGNDFEPLAARLHDIGIRLVAPTSLGMTDSPITLDDLNEIDFSTEGRTKTLQLILEAMNIHRVDMLIGHSAGAWTMYKAGASWENVRSIFGINPGGDRPNRTLRPFLIMRFFAVALHWSIGRFFLKPFLAHGYKILGFRNITTDDNGINLITSQQYITQQGFAEVPHNARLIRDRKLPVLLTFALNDKIVEPSICSNMAFTLLGIPPENTVTYADDKTPNRDPFFVPEGWFARCLIFARGGHIVHIAHEQEIIEQIQDVLKHINKTRSRAASWQ